MTELWFDISQRIPTGSDDNDKVTITAGTLRAWSERARSPGTEAIEQAIERIEDEDSDIDAYNLTAEWELIKQAARR